MRGPHFEVPLGRKHYNNDVISFNGKGSLHTSGIDG